MNRPQERNRSGPMQDELPLRPGSDGDDVSLLTLLNLILRQWRVWVTSIVAVLIATVLLSMFSATTHYIADSRFIPQEAQGSTRLTGLAGQLGGLGGTTVGGDVLAFYAELLQSRELLRDVARTSFRFSTGGAEPDSLGGTLDQLYGIEGESPERRIARAADILDSQVDVTRQNSTGIITLAIEAPWPELAEQINRRMLELVVDFNRGKRRSQAVAEREFTEARMEQSRTELRDAEAKLEGFLAQNRSYESSPHLSFEAARLRREVDLRQELYTTSVQAYERARIDEIRDSPVMTILEPPEAATHRGGANPVLSVVLAIVVGGMLGLVIIFGRAYAGRLKRTHPEEYSEFQARLHSLAAVLTLRRFRSRRA